MGVYAFYDYDGEPIYVGQTWEGVSVRIGRHLTGQRSDAVAKNVLDPFEVAEVEVWPLRQYQEMRIDASGKKKLARLERAVFDRAFSQSKFRAVLNENAPRAHKGARRPSKLPRSVRGSVITDEVRKIRGHADFRIARRALTISRLAQVVSERKVSLGLRRTLSVQAKRLQWLAAKRLRDLES